MNCLVLVSSSLPLNKIKNKMTFKKITVLIIFSLTFGFSSFAYGWSFTGHVIIAQIAYDNLTPRAKAKADTLAATIFTQLPGQEQRKLDQHYATASTFAKVAVLPDLWRKWKLSTVYHAFNAPVPSVFGDADAVKLQPLHFINLDYPDSLQCGSPNPMNAVWAIQKSEQALAQSTNKATQAVSLVLLEHFVGDIHQPLHVLSNVSHGCQGDAGGNAFCLKQSASGQCRQSLHALWDNAVGFIKPKMNIAQAAYRLEQRYPKTQLEASLKNEDPMCWAKINYGYAGFIYNLPEYQKPTPTYYQQGQILATTQMALAGYRLADILNKQLT